MRILTIKVIALMLIVLIVGAPARRAHAATVDQVVAALQIAYTMYEKYGTDELSLSEATDQMIAAIDSAKIEIMARIDGIGAADGRACARSTIILFEDIAQLSPDTQMALASDAVACMTLIESYLDVLEDRASVDKLGFALNALGPVTMMARAHVGLPESAAVADVLINGNNSIIAKLIPVCGTITLQGDAERRPEGIAGPRGLLRGTEQQIRCTAYNGDTGFGLSWVGDPNYATEKIKAEDTATRNTSRKIAQALVGLIE